jgi:HSP20 family protein
MTRIAAGRARLRLVAGPYASVAEVVWEGLLPRAAAPTVWQPPVDVCETANEVHVKVEAAGLDEDELEVTLRDSFLIISGERPWTPPDDQARVHVSEIRYGPIRVEIDVGDELRGAPVRWSYERGMIEVRIGKPGGRR